MGCQSCSSPALPRGSVIGSQSGAHTVAAYKSLLNVAPVSVAVDANGWQNVGTGIFSKCGTGLNHAVLAVGYDSSSLKIKNSWGTWWGDKGYVHLAIGDTCGVLDQMYLVKVRGSGPTPPTPPSPPSPPTPPSPDCKVCHWSSQCPRGDACFVNDWNDPTGCCKP